MASKESPQKTQGVPRASELPLSILQGLVDHVALSKDVVLHAVHTIHHAIRVATAEEKRKRAGGDHMRERADSNASIDTLVDEDETEDAPTPTRPRTESNVSTGTLTSEPDDDIHTTKACAFERLAELDRLIPLHSSVGHEEVPILWAHFVSPTSGLRAAKLRLKQAVCCSFIFLERNSLRFMHF